MLDQRKTELVTQIQVRYKEEQEKVNTVIEALVQGKERGRSFLSSKQTASALYSIKYLERLIDYESELKMMSLPKDLFQEVQIEMDDTKITAEIGKVCDLRFRKKPSSQVLSSLKQIKEQVG